MKTLTLEPCPMCGDDPYILYHPEDDPNKIQVKVQCECGLTITHWIGIIEDRWNKRIVKPSEQMGKDLVENYQVFLKDCQAENAELRELLQRNLDQMKLINGDDANCVISDPEYTCKNHSLIHETEQALTRPPEVKHG